MRISHMPKVSQAALCVAGLVGLASPALAQSDSKQTGDEGTSASHEVIVVTARRVAENLQDVPVAITALSGKMLEQQGISNVQDLTKAAPGLNITSSPRGDATPFVILRGQRVIDTAAVLDPPVLFYVNEIPILRVNGLNQSFFDVQQIQVLRGPQGTLFGKSTTGGAILTSTVRPNFDGVNGYFRLTGGSESLTRAEGAINVPLNDKLAVRVAAIASKRDGYVRVRNIPNFLLNDENFDAERLSIRYRDERVTNDLILSRYSSHTNGSATQVFAFDPAAPYAAYLPAGAAATFAANIAANQKDFWSVGLDFKTRPSARDKSYDVANITTIELNDKLTLKNVAGYRKIDFPYLWDFDGSSLAYQQFTDYANIWQVSEELQLQGKSSRFDWIVGAFYFYEKGRDGAFIHTISTNKTNESGTGITNESYSAFASGTYRFGLEGLSLTAGLRISHDKREGRGVQTTRTGNGPISCTFSGVTLTPPDCIYNSSISFTEPSWSVSLNYKANRDLLLYVAHRHGYRSGGVQNRGTSLANSVPFGAEKVNDVELGAKVDTMLGPDTNLVFNVAGYVDWYKGLQRILSFVSPGTTTIVSGVVSAADATIKGVEVESRLRSHGFELSGSLGYTDTKFNTFNQSIASTVAADLSGQAFSLVPKWTWAVRGSYTYDLDHPGENLVASVGANSVSSVSLSEATETVGKFIPGYTLFDARLAWNNVRGTNVDLAISATNLSDKEYSTGGNTFSSSLGWAIRYPGAPRRFQVAATYNF